MRQLHWVLLLVLTLFWQLAPASAAGRVLLGAGTPGEAAATLRTSPTVQGLRATAQRKGSVKVIVGLRVPFAPAGTLGASAARQQTVEIATASTAVRSRFAAAIGRAPASFRSYGSIPFVALEVTAAELDRLASDPDVVTVTENIVLRANLTQSATLIRAPEAWETGFTGAGQTIAIIDTGVDKTHSFLGGRVVSEACYTTGQCPGGTNSSTAAGSGMPCSGPSSCLHGTHVAGIAAGYQSRSFSGIAPGAQIIAIKVFTVTGGSAGVLLSDLNAGLERVYALRGSFKIAAVNMSLGWRDAHFASSCDTYQPSTTALIDQLKSQGIASVVASGNEGQSNGISFPSCISSAVSVGSVSDSNWGTCSGQGITSASTAADKVACYSNASSELSLLAPGSPITSSVPGGSFATYHGTSMAAPHVAGAFALLREKAGGASPDDMLKMLKDTGVRVTDYRNARITTPRIDVKAALDSLDAGGASTLIDLRINGSGHGSVTFSPSGSQSACTQSCRNSFGSGKVVTLTAAAGTRSSFAGWGGACSGAGPCTVTVNGTMTVFAVFYTISSGPPQLFTFSKTGQGEGSVSMLADGQETACSGNCTRTYGQNTMVKLTAVPAYGTRLTSWSGACRGSKSSCVVRMTAPKSVNANFEPLPFFPLVYTRGGAASGTVAMSVSGVSVICGDSCTNQFPQGSRITITAIPAGGKSFTGWTGICRGRKASCTFTLKAPASLTAGFN